MEVLALPALAVTIVAAFIFFSAKWLGKKTSRALYRFGEPENEQGDKDDARA